MPRSSIKLTTLRLSVRRSNELKHAVAMILKIHLSKTNCKNEIVEAYCKRTEQSVLIK